MTLDPAVAVVRRAVRRALADLPAPATGAGATVLVACSGGADSLALLAATVFEARKARWRVVGVCVDHGLQAGSAEHTTRVVEQMAGLGADRAVSVRVSVDPDGRGPEDAARRARYTALTEAAEQHSAAVVLLGHTLDDQAETVLLGLTRGSGGRSLAGMRMVSGPFRRPLLGVGRAQTETACRAEGIEPWTDPHNHDPAFTRARIRHRVLPVLEQELGPGVVAALARTAALLRDDVDALDAAADRALGEHRPDRGLEVDRLQTLDAAVRRRLLRLVAVRAGSPPGELFRTHLLEVDRLVGDYRGQQRVELPGHVHVVREGGRLWFRGPTPDT